MITVNDDKEREKRSILAIVILALVRLVLYISNGSVCGITFYQPKEPDLSELFERGICNEKADEHSKEGFYGTGGSCAGGSYHISSECLLPLVRTTCRARRAEKLCKQEIIGNCVLQKGGMKWLRIRF